MLDKTSITILDHKSGSIIIPTIRVHFGSLRVSVSLTVLERVY